MAYVRRTATRLVCSIALLLGLACLFSGDPESTY